MIKLAAIAFFPVLVASLFAPDETKPSPTWNYARTAAAEQDRQLLDVISQQESTRAATESADHAFLNMVEAEARDEAIPVRRAIAIERPALRAIPVTADPMAEASAEGYEVRRAIPVERTASPASVADRRNAMQQPFVTLIEEQPEARRAAVPEGRRSSITIFGDQVIVRSRVPMQ